MARRSARVASKRKSSSSSTSLSDIHRALLRYRRLSSSAEPKDAQLLQYKASLDALLADLEAHVAELLDGNDLAASELRDQVVQLLTNTLDVFESIIAVLEARVAELLDRNDSDASGLLSLLLQLFRNGLRVLASIVAALKLQAQLGRLDDDV